MKPENILYKISEYPDDDGNDEYEIKIGDFGTEGKNGGTPGWTWPKFMTERKPGRSDMYSVGLLILYVMCESDDLFYSIRNNYVRTGQSWVPEFRNIPLIKLVIQMIDLELNVQQCQDQWNEMVDTVEQGATRKNCCEQEQKSNPLLAQLLFCLCCFVAE